MTPFVFLKCCGRALVRWAGDLVSLGAGGKLLVNVGEEVWGEWNREEEAREQRAELEALARAAAQEVRQEIAEIVREVAAGQPEEVRRRVAFYLAQVPGRVRQVMGAEDLSATLPAHLPLGRPADLAPFLAVTPLTGSLSLACLEGHTAGVQDLAVGTRTTLSAGLDGTLHRWDVTNQTSALLLGRERPLTSVALDPNGQRALVGGEDGQVCLLGLQGGEELALPGCPHAVVRRMAFSPDGRTALAAAGSFHDQGEPRGCGVWLWDLATGAGRRVSLHEGPVCAAAFLPDGRHVLSGGWDRTLCLWETSTGSERRRFGGHEGPVWCIALSPDGRLVATGSTDGAVHLWSLHEGQLVCSLHGHTDWVRCVGFSPDGRHLVSGSDDGTLRAWEVTTGRQAGLFQGHTESVTCVSFLPDGRRFLSGSADASLRLWETTG